MLVVIPAYNPDHHLIDTLKDLKSVLDNKIIIVNDGSDKNKNKIFEEAKKYGTVIKHDINMGKGKAMRTALEYIEKKYSKEDGVVFVDADHQHKGNDVRKVIEAYYDNEDALILGVRIFDSKDVPIKSRIGNKITRTIFKIFTSKYISDTQTGLRVISTKYIPFLLNVSGDRYEYEMNMLIDLVSKKTKIVEVPIETVYESKKNLTSHFRVFRDSFLVYKKFLKFAMSSLSCTFIDYISFITFINLFGNTAPMLILSNFSARLISGTINYNINKRIVFKHKAKNKSGFHFFLLATGIICTNSLILLLLTKIFGIVPEIAKLMVELMLFIVNYTVQHKYIFKS